MNRKLSSQTLVATRSFATLLLTATFGAALPSAAHADCSSGAPPVVAATCNWAIVHGNPSRDTMTRAAHDTAIGGSICGQAVSIDRGSTINGDIVTTTASGASIRVRTGATVDGTMMTPTRTTPMEPGSLLGDCDAAIASVASTIPTLDSPPFRSMADVGNVKVERGGNFTLAATEAVNVIDFSSLVLDDGATLVLDGSSIPDATFVLRVNRRLYLHYQSSIVLTGGATAERVILYGREECRIGREVTGEGTVFCPYDSIKIGQSTTWNGSLVGGGDRIELRQHVELTHVPSAITVP